MAKSISTVIPLTTKDVLPAKTHRILTDVSGDGPVSFPSQSGKTISSVTTSVSSMTFNISWESNTSTAPSGFKPAVLRAVTYLQSQFVDPITVNITVGYGSENGNLLGSNTLGQSQCYIMNVTYSQLLTALSADSRTTTDGSVVASLPSTDPTGGGHFWISQAQAKALGLYSANATGTDGWIGLSSHLAFTYDNSGGVAGGTYDFEAVVLHEMTEILGRMRGAGGTIGLLTPSYYVPDLLTYTGSNTRHFTSGGYFSIDNGTTNLGAWNTVGGGDLGDWASSVTNDAVDAFSNSGVTNVFSANDIKLMDAIGFDLTGFGPPPPPTPPTPTGVTMTLNMGTLQKLQSSNTLAAKTTVAVFTQTGGQSSDTFTYSLGGTGATSFNLSSSGVLSTGNVNVTGLSTGKLYPITVTAHDVTGNLSSPSIPFNIVVCSSANDTVTLSTISGINTSATTIIYGLAGIDTINGTSMTGPIWFIGGANSDTMTGGSGVNTYVYSITSESATTTPDVITNFNVSTDKLNISTVGSALRYAGSLGTTITAKSYGWKVVSGNTFVYVNTSTKVIAINTVAMKVQLTGILTLSSGNFS